MPFRRTRFAGTAPAFSLATLSPGASARAVPAEVAASNQLELLLSLEGLSSPTTSQISYIIKHDEQAAFQETDTFKNRYKSKK